MGCRGLLNFAMEEEGEAAVGFFQEQLRSGMTLFTMVCIFKSVGSVDRFWLYGSLVGEKTCHSSSSSLVDTWKLFRGNCSIVYSFI